MSCCWLPDKKIMIMKKFFLLFHAFFLLISSLTAQRYLGNNSNAMQSTMEKLSSGYRINRAGDDAAGLQLSENLRSQIEQIAADWIARGKRSNYPVELFE